MESNANAQQHIMRTTSVYSNIPLGKLKMLNNVIKKVQAKTFVASPLSIKKQYKKHQTLTTPRQQVQDSRVSSPLPPLEKNKNESGGTAKAVRYDSKVYKSNRQKNSHVSFLPSRRSSNIHLPQDLIGIVKTKSKAGDSALKHHHNHDDGAVVTTKFEQNHQEKKFLHQLGKTQRASKDTDTLKKDIKRRIIEIDHVYEHHTTCGAGLFTASINLTNLNSAQEDAEVKSTYRCTQQKDQIKPQKAEKDTYQQQFHDNRSLSCRSGTSSFPEILTRSNNNNNNHDNAEDEHPKFQPSHRLEKFGHSQGALTASEKQNNSNYIVSANISMHSIHESFLDLGNENHVSINMNSSIIVEPRENNELGKTSIMSQCDNSVNLPQISQNYSKPRVAKQNAISSMIEQKTNNYHLDMTKSAAVTKNLTKPTNYQKPPVINTFKQRAQSLNKVPRPQFQILTNEQEEQFFTTQIGLRSPDKAALSNKKKLHPLEIVEVALSKESMMDVDISVISPKTSIDFNKISLKKLGQSLVVKVSTPKKITDNRKNSVLDIDDSTTPQKESFNMAEEGNKTCRSKLTNSNVKDMISRNAKNSQKSPLRSSLIDRNTSTNTANVRKNQRDSAILAQSLNAEPFYRRAVRRLGWKEVSQPTFHIRLNISDLEGTASDLQGKQFYNHFPQNRELVTKMGLCKNLWFSCSLEFEQQIQHCFPRCYDLSVPQQAETFVKDFNQTAILSIIKVMANHFLATRSSDMKFLLAEYSKKEQFAEPRRFFKPNFKNICNKQDEERKAGNLLGICKVYEAYAFCKQLSNSLQFKNSKKDRRQKPASFKNFNDRNIQDLTNFHTQLIESGIPEAGFSTYESFKIVRLHQTLESQLIQYRQIDGKNNIWIVKPSYNARGLGIFCSRNLREIMPETVKSQQKVVQKYIERPFFVHSRRKFDFRQWVLVNNWEPLDVCVFQSAYLKICGNAFDLTQVQDVHRHLSNYSIQKENGDKDELVMSSSQFEAFMRENMPEHANFTWEKDMFPKINDVVWRTLKSVQENFEYKSYAFEVYGFDIVLDEDLRPWVIEVNLSPACCERAQWLTNMLNDSCTDALGHIQSRILTANPAESWTPEMAKLREQVVAAPHRSTQFLNPEGFYEKFGIQERWIRLPESIKEIDEFNNLQSTMSPQKGMQFEVKGLKHDLRFERKLDKQYRQETSAVTIQRLYRGFLGRRIQHTELNHQNAIKIQKNVRMLLAKLQLIRLRKHFNATIIQKQMRRRVAQQVAQQLRREKLLMLMTALAIKLQNRFRIAKAKAIVDKLRKEWASQKCQRFMRGYLAHVMMLKERSRRCQIVHIQLFYKRRFKAKTKHAMLLQRMIKRRLVQNKVGKIRVILQGASKLQHLFRMHKMKVGLDRLRYFSAVITIQAIFRMLKVQTQYKTMLQNHSRDRLRTLWRKVVLKRLRLTSITLKVMRDRYAETVQKQLRMFLAKKQVVHMRILGKQNTNALILQRVMKGYLGRCTAKLRRIQIGATIIIQSLVRGFLTRCRLLRKQKLKSKGVKKKMQKVEAQMRLVELYLGSSKGMKSLRTSQISAQQTYNAAAKGKDILIEEAQRWQQQSTQVAGKFVGQSSELDKRSEMIKTVESQRSLNNSNGGSSLRRSRQSDQTKQFLSKDQAFKTPRRKINAKSKGIALLNDYQSEIGFQMTSRKQWAQHQVGGGANQSERRSNLRHYNFEKSGQTSQFDIPTTLPQRRQSDLKKEANLAHSGKNKTKQANSGRLKISQQPQQKQKIALPKVPNAKASNAAMVDQLNESCSNAALLAQIAIYSDKQNNNQLGSCSSKKIKIKTPYMRQHSKPYLNQKQGQVVVEQQQPTALIEKVTSSQLAGRWSNHKQQMIVSQQQKQLSFSSKFSELPEKSRQAYNQGVLLVTESEMILASSQAAALTSNSKFNGSPSEQQSKGAFSCIGKSSLSRLPIEQLEDIDKLGQPQFKPVRQKVASSRTSRIHATTDAISHNGNGNGRLLPEILIATTAQSIESGGVERDEPELKSAINDSIAQLTNNDITTGPYYKDNQLQQQWIGGVHPKTRKTYSQVPTVLRKTSKNTYFVEQMIKRDQERRHQAINDSKRMIKKS